MKPGCTVLTIDVFLFLFFFSPGVFAQYPDASKSGFYTHLTENHLLDEKLILNKRLQKTFAAFTPVVDSLKLSMALTYLELHQPDSCKKTLLTICKPAGFSALHYQLYLSLLIVSRETDLALAKVRSKETVKPACAADTEVSLKILNREAYDKSSFPELSATFLDLSARYETTPKPSPLLSGIYSGLLPGLGKVYIGYPLQGITSFAACMLLAAQTAEAYARSGPARPRFIISASLFGCFYLGNIWGSATMAKKKKHDYLKQLDHEILDYHHAFIRKHTY